MLVLNLIFAVLLMCVSISTRPTDRDRMDEKVDQAARISNNEEAAQCDCPLAEEKDVWLEWMNDFSELLEQNPREQRLQKSNQMHRVFSNLFRPGSPKHSNPIRHTPLGRQRSET